MCISNRCSYVLTHRKDLLPKEAKQKKSKKDKLSENLKDLSEYNILVCLL